jgi:hypothetical protein
VYRRRPDGAGEALRRSEPDFCFAPREGDGSVGFRVDSGGDVQVGLVAVAHAHGRGTFSRHVRELAAFQSLVFAPDTYKLRTSQVGIGESVARDTRIIWSIRAELR